MKTWMLVSFTALALAACGEHNDYGNPGNGTLGKGDAPPGTFREVFARVIQPKCIHCHNGQKKADSFKTYELVMSRHNRVVPGNPEQSKIVKLIRSGEMPEFESKLSDELISVVENWIAAGAPQ